MNGPSVATHASKDRRETSVRRPAERGAQHALRAVRSADQDRRAADAVRMAVGPYLASPGAQNEILALQQTAGNRAVDALLRSGSGQPLEPSTQTYMEQRFGHDFSQVQVHRDAQAAESAEAIGAKAYTVGHDIVFGASRYAPETSEGKRLLAHELAHVVQQSRGGSVPTLDVDSPTEMAANQAATAVSEGNSPVQVGEASAVGLARDADDEKPESWRDWMFARGRSLYRKAHEMAPPYMKPVLEQAKEEAKPFIGHIPDEGLRAAEPAVTLMEGVLGVKPPSPPPAATVAQAPVMPQVWVGMPPFNVRQERKRQERKEEEEAKKVDPAALPPAVPRPGALTGREMLGFDPLTQKPDPPPTQFEKKLQTNKPFEHKFVYEGEDTPAPISPAEAVLGFNPLPLSLRPPPPPPRPGPGAVLRINGVDVTPIRDSKTRELQGYRVHMGGETILEMDRNGNPLTTRGLEAPLETPVVDPIDVAMFLFDVGPLIGKGLTAGGKALLRTTTKTGLKEAARVAPEEAVTLGSRRMAGEIPLEAPTVPLRSAEDLVPPGTPKSGEIILDEPRVPQLTEGSFPPGRSVGPGIRPGSGPGTSIGELAEPSLIRNFHPKARQLPRGQPGFDAIEGETLQSAHLSLEKVKGGGRLPVVEQRVKGGNAIQLKVVDVATPDNITRNVNHALERADNALKGLRAPSLERSLTPKGEVGTRVVVTAPDRITIHLHLNNAPVNDELLKAAEEAVRTSPYARDLPRVDIFISGQ